MNRCAIYGDNNGALYPIGEKMAHKECYNKHIPTHLFCQNCNYRTTKIIANYTKNTEERECLDCGCVMVVDYGNWNAIGSRFDDRSSEKYQHKNPIWLEEYGPRQDQNDPDNVLGADYPHENYDYSTDDLDDYEYKQTL